MLLRASIVLLVPLGLALAACSGGGSTPTPTPGTASASTPGATPDSGSSATAATTPGAGQTAAVTPDGSSVALDAAAQAAAESTFHGLVGGGCDQAADPSVTCLESRSDAATIAGGISAWRVGAQGGSSYTGVLGRAADGSWKLWFSSQDAISQLTLPGRMRVCADGQGLNLRKTAATTADRIASIEDDTLVDGDQFVLTEPGTPTQPGSGWYHLMTDPDGWAYSQYLIDASQPNCAARTGTPAGG